MDLLIYPRSSFGPNRSGLLSGLVSNYAWTLHWAPRSFGLGEWDGEPIFLTPSKVIAHDLKAAGQHISEGELILYILGGLGSDFESIEVNLTSRDAITL